MKKSIDKKLFSIICITILLLMLYTVFISFGFETGEMDMFEYDLHYYNFLILSRVFSFPFFLIFSYLSLGDPLLLILSLILNWLFYTILVYWLITKYRNL